MTDHFALLNEARRPWIDIEALKARFLALSVELHPDRMHNRSPAERDSANRRYSELNAAYACLREPKERLAHLLELERGSRPEEVQKIPSDTIETFMEVNRACGRVDALLTQQARTTSPILKAELFQQAAEQIDELKALEGRLSAKLDHLVTQLKKLNMAWETAPPVGSPTRVSVLPCSRLEQIYRDLSYLSRWLQQLRERVVQISI